MSKLAGCSSCLWSTRPVCSSMNSNADAHVVNLSQGCSLRARNAWYRLEDEEGLVLTPFEKNLEVWRQLWRVLERSDIIVQVEPLQPTSLRKAPACSNCSCA